VPTNQDFYSCFEAGWTIPPTVRPKHHSEFSNYKNLKYIGTVPSGANFGSRSNYREIHPISLKITRIQELRDIAKDHYSIVKPTNENVLFSIRALEQKPEPKEFDPKFRECYEAAKNHFTACYSQIFRDGVATNEETVEYIDFTKSPGYTGTHSELRTKYDLATDRSFARWFRANGHLKTIPLWVIYPKTEYKLLADILKNKIRLFTIPPYDLLFEQIRFGKRATLRLKNHLWSAYGFNPYSGGVNKLANRLLKNDIFWCLDISGWDKFLPLMSDFYSYLTDLILSDIPKDLQPNYLWMVEHTVKFYFKTPYGDVFKKDYGNPSGSGCTTRDNTCIHIWIITSALIYAYYKKYGFLPTSTILNSQPIMVFGDDVVGSVSEDFDYILTPYFWDNIYEAFGLKLKFVNCGRGIFDQLEFLGFKFTKKNNHYYPKYDVERLATSFIYKGIDNDNYDAYISRTFTLMIMSYPTDHFQLFYKSYQDICDYFYTLSIEPSPTVLAFLTYRTLPLYEIEALYTGAESANSDFLKFFLSGILDVGFCNIK
jgi:hypothetical protein